MIAPPHTTAADTVRAQPAVTRAVWEALAPELQAKAFFITGVESLATVARVRDLAASLTEGEDFEALRQKIEAEISPYLVTSTDEKERAAQQAAASSRALVILRMQGFQAHARVQDAMLRAHIRTFPYCMYLASPDDKVRPSHAALHGKIIPTDHPFWDNHTPPWEFGCRCDKTGMMQSQVDEIRHEDSGKPPEDQRVLGPEQLRQLTQHQRLVAPGGAGFIDVRTPREKKGTGYEWRVQEDATSVEQVITQLPPEDQEAFVQLAEKTELSDGRTLLEWWRPTFHRTPAPIRPTTPAAPTAPTTAITPITLPTLKAELEAALTGQAVVSTILSPTDQLPSSARALILAREEAIRHAIVEHASLFRSGMPRQDFVGTAGEFVLPLEVITQDGILTHTHPAGLPPSARDLEMLFSRRLLELRAATRHGNYSIHPTSRRQLGNILARILQLSPQVKKSAGQLKIPHTQSELYRAMDHLIWQILAAENLIHYSYTPVTSQSILDALAAPRPPSSELALDDMSTFRSPCAAEYEDFLAGRANYPGLDAAISRYNQRVAAGLEPPEALPLTLH